MRVLAASSFTEAFQDLGRAFEQAHPELQVVAVFGGSQTLRLQIEQGASADVFASADATHIEALGDRLSDVRPFAENTLVLIHPPENPSGIKAFKDLVRARRLVVGGTEVPVGRHTQALLDRAGTRYGGTWRQEVEQRIVSREANVRLVRAKVELGEADAALVYQTDVSSRVRAVAIPLDLAVATPCLQGRLRDAPHPEGARAWLAFVASPAGVSILARHGFRVP